MRIARRIGIVAAIAALVVAGISAQAADKVTVGDFVKRVAEAKNLAATSPVVALDSLRGLGCTASVDLNDTLTEGAVVDISRCVGVKVNTSQPGAEFSAVQVDGYFSAFAQSLSTDPNDDDEATVDVHKPGHGTDPLLKGKGKKKGLRTPEDPV
jgi:hypothetical protein